LFNRSRRGDGVADPVRPVLADQAVAELDKVKPAVLAQYLDEEQVPDLGGVDAG